MTGNCLGGDGFEGKGVKPAASEEQDSPGAKYPCSLVGILLTILIAEMMETPPVHQQLEGRISKGKLADVGASKLEIVATEALFHSSGAGQR
jgi:hypothetical protein